MKTSLHFVIGLLVTLAWWQTSAQFTEDFEGTFLPTGWAKELGDTSNDITQSADANHTPGGQHSARFSSYNSAGDYNQYLFTPAITVQTGVNDRITFWHKKYNDNNETLEWGIAIGGQSSSNVSSWTEVTLSTDWQKTEVDLSAYDGQTIYFAWHYYGDHLYYAYVDDVKNDALVSCPSPQNVGIGDITDTTVDLYWDEVAGAQGFEWEIVPAGQNPGEGNAVVSGTVTGTGAADPDVDNAGPLQPHTDYEFYVRTDCGGGSFSDWEGPVSFTTAYGIYSPPYLQDFTTYIPNYWEEATGPLTGPTSIGSSRWTQDDFANDTGHPNGKAAIINLYSNTAQEWLISPHFDLSAGGYQLELDVAVTDHADTTPSNMGSDDEVRLLISSDGGSTWTTLYIWNASNTPSNTGTHVIIDLSTYTQSDVVFAFWASEGNTDDIENYDFFVDNFEVNTPPTCAEPTDLAVSNITTSTADLSWTDNTGDPTTQYIIEYREFGTSSWNSVIATGTSYTLTGLTPHTHYEWQLTGDCGGGNTGGPIPGPDFWTACTVVTTFPYVDSFEDTEPNVEADWTGSCWTADPANTGSSSISGPFRWTPYEGPTPSSGTGPDNAYDGTKYAYTEASGSNTGDVAYLISPDFDMSALSHSRLSFYYHMYGSDMGRLSVEIYDGTSWTEIWIAGGSHHSSSSDPWTLKELDIPNTTTKIRFKGVRGDGYLSDMAVDYVTIYDVPCPEPSDLAVSNITATSADLSWTDNTGDPTTQYTIEYREVGTTTWNSVTTTGTSYTLTGLTPHTRYEWQLTADCGSNGTSTTVSGPEFQTACATVSSFP
ncbi:MAG: hypothetical protein GXO27_00085, partial [Chlorobi bacterium]|nr:hypothetical protein [Chlorobiota bacterium]